MKTLILVAMALGLSACAHETTTIDRELALKLADRPQVVVASSPAPIVNVNNYNGVAQQQQREPQQADVPRYDQQCRQSPTFDIQGNQTGTEKHCFGVAE
jgi:hypothetical protein